MDLSNFPDIDAGAARRDGWNPTLKIRFLENLSVKGNVRAACLLVGMSHEAAYRLRRRDPVFARGWNGAIELARENSADVLASRAIDGIVEEIWYRGELVGTRTRHDTRLLLAHVARLDRIAEQNAGAADAERFDELLALIGGIEPAEDLPLDAAMLPPTRGCYIAEAEEYAARDHRYAALGEEDLFSGESALGPEADEALENECADLAEEAGLAAAASWDHWFRRACGAVDAVAGVLQFPPSTVSTVSTSELEHQENRHPEPVSGSTSGLAQFDHSDAIDPETGSG